MYGAELIQRTSDTWPCSYFKMKSYGAMATFGPGKKIYRSRIPINIARSLRLGILWGRRNILT